MNTEYEQEGSWQLVIHVDMDGVLVDFSSALETLDERTLNEYRGRLDEVPGIFSKMKPMKDGIETIEHLSHYARFHILSTAPWGNPTAWSDKLEWVQRHMPGSMYKRLTLTHHKELLNGDFLIDDRFANGAYDFTGELIPFGSARFPDWIAVREYLSDVILQEKKPLGKIEGTYPERMLKEAHSKTSHNQEVILNSRRCVCTYCGHSFDPDLVEQPLDFEIDTPGRPGTLFCPSCGIDAVLGSACGYRLTDRFILACSEAWFNGFSRISQQHTEDHSEKDNKEYST